MPIPFTSIPLQIASSIVQKLELDDFINFQQCSKKSFDVSQKLKTRFLVSHDFRGKDVFLRFRNERVMTMSFRDSISRLIQFKSTFHGLPLRFEANTITIEGNLTDEFCTALTNYLFHSNSSTKALSLQEISCSDDSFNRLSEALGATKLYFNRAVSQEYIRVEATRKMYSLKAYANSLLNDADLLRLKNVPILTLNGTNITSEGINLILKDYLINRIAIESWTIGSTNAFQKDVVFSGIPYIVFSVLMPNTELLYLGDMEILLDYNNIYIRPRRNLF